jgi:hypothetical protein
MTSLACVDGGLICGPVIVTIIGAVLGWMGYRRHRCAESGCEHKCEELEPEVSD